MRAVLEPLGHTIVEASSGREALRHVLASDFAVILMDVSMPNMDGFETAAIIQQRERSRYVPMIFVTAGIQDDAALGRAYSSGAVDYIAKPFNPMVLRSKVGVFVEIFNQQAKIIQQAESLREIERERTEQQLRSVKNELERAHLAEVATLLGRERRLLSDVLSSVTEGRLKLCASRQELPSALPRIGNAVSLQNRAAMATLRSRMSEAANRMQYPKDRLNDLLTAASEAAMNAIVHGDGGKAEVRASDAAGTIQVWVTDRGEGIALDKLPRATLERGYSTKNTLGHGFWLMLNTADKISLLTAQSGTTVVVEKQATMPDTNLWDAFGHA